MSLKQQIKDDMKTAMKAKDKARLTTVRLMLAAIKQQEVDKQIELTDSDVLIVLNKMVKQRRDSIVQYNNAGRNELAAVEQDELRLIQTYLPQPFSDQEIASLLDQVITDTGASGKQDMGRVMAQLKAKLQGRADMSKVSGLVRARLSA
ncbi:MAG: GatB/YqeY domain-containing protein [bacterium]